MNSQSADDLYGRVFPGEKWTISFDATDEQTAAMTAHVDAHTDDPDERLMFLQMIGLAESESAFNPSARDAWTKKKPVAVESTTCGNGHSRELFSYRDNQGHSRCRECRRKWDVEKRERKKAAA